MPGHVFALIWLITAGTLVAVYALAWSNKT